MYGGYIRLGFVGRRGRRRGEGGGGGGGGGDLGGGGRISDIPGCLREDSSNGCMQTLKNVPSSK